MINWRFNVAQLAAAVILPADINLRALQGGSDSAIQQPIDEIIEVAWIVAKNQGNNGYQSKICDARFCGQPSEVGNYDNAQLVANEPNYVDMQGIFRIHWIGRFREQ